MSTTNYTAFEDTAQTHDERHYDAATMLDRLAAYFREDGYTADDFTERCDEAWERAGEDD